MEGWPESIRCTVNFKVKPPIVMLLVKPSPQNTPAQFDDAGTIFPVTKPKKIINNLAVQDPLDMVGNESNLKDLEMHT